jgi:NAD-dependent dihydropyrimidine dehydrogenase PreA subunit
MSISLARRSHAVLQGGPGSGMNAADRAVVTRMLLERGLEVSCRCDDETSPSATVVVDDGGATGELRPVHAEGVDAESLVEAIAGQSARPSGAHAWKPWFPVIDYSRCTNCMQCLSFCLFDVYGVSADQKIQVQNQNNCKTECPACSRVCPEVAIMFPKYRHGPINGEDVKADDVRREAMKVDISALLGGDIYSMLRDRSVKAKSRFSKERDDDRALKERQNCLIALKQDLDIPAEVLAALPTPEEILAKAEAARQRAEAALQPGPSSPSRPSSPGPSIASGLPGTGN